MCTWKENVSDHAFKLCAWDNEGEDNYHVIIEQTCSHLIEVNDEHGGLRDLDSLLIYDMNAVRSNCLNDQQPHKKSEC